MDLFIYREYFGFSPFLWVSFSSGSIRDIDDYFAMYGDEIIIVVTKAGKYTLGSKINPRLNQLHGFGFSVDK